MVRWRLKLSEFDYEIKYKKGSKNGNADALSRIEPEFVNINTLESTELVIKETNSPINMFKTQIIIKKITSGSVRIKNEKIFKSSRKTIDIKNLDREFAITLLRNHFNPNMLNAILIEDEFYNTFKTTYEELFSRNEKFKIIRCSKILTDIEDENK